MNDPEIQAMSNLATALDTLDETQRGRVLRWAADRYEVEVDVVQAPVSADVAAGVGGLDNSGVTQSEIAEEAPKYKNFAQFFSEAGPISDQDKALVAAYWMQEVGGHEEWPARLLNKELKNLGHSLKNITQALTGNMNRKPQRVVQVAKNGKSKQGTKTYQITHAGMLYVQGMLSRSDD